MANPNKLIFLLTIWNYYLFHSVYCENVLQSNCSLLHDGLFYDFSALSAKDYHEFTETSHLGYNQEDKYYISLCHPLRNVPSPCQTLSNETLSGVCITKVSNDTGNNKFEEKKIAPYAGKIPKDGLVFKENVITYQYESGEECTSNSNGKKMFYTISLHFLCPQMLTTFRETGPILVASKKCEYTFFWQTISACPKKISHADYEKCTIEFNNSQEKINLHMLHSPSYYNITSKYLMNICGPITNFDCGNTNTSVCDISDPKNPKPVAAYNDISLNWQSGVLSMNYQKIDKKVTIDFYCRKSSHTPYIIVNNDNKDELGFSVETSTVCTPKLMNCQLHDKKGNLYDLNELYLENANYGIPVTHSDSDGKKVI